MDHSRIHQLDNILANQIAAGEVVERPASVVKELIENALDAGATRIEVDVEKGGASLIRVKDNGSGIHPDDLTLALSRHATSKISTTEDLSAIHSLGFRGEALASISSVSRLTLISRWHQSEQALQAEAAGRDMAVTVSAAGLTEGTVVEVRELFFNTPARRRFMRTDKTEFRHLETVIYRMALSHPEVSFLLKHNGKKIRHFIAADTREAQERRVAQIMGKEFLAHCVHFSMDHSVENNEMKFQGWLGMPDYHRSVNDGQFVFVNGRPVKDPIVSHAIREAYDGRLPPGRLPAYIIDIQLNPETVDVNVHPTKHEVRFQYQRMVHDLITRALSEVLEQGIETLSVSPAPFSEDWQSDKNPSNSSGSYGGYAGAGGGYSGYRENIAEKANAYSEFIQDGLSTERSAEQSNDQPSGLVIESQYLLVSDNNSVSLVSIKAFMNFQWPRLWLQQFEKTEVETAPILFPLRVTISKKQANELMNHQPLFKQLGLEVLVDDSLQAFKLLRLPRLFAGIEAELFSSILLSSLKFNSTIELINTVCRSLAEDKRALESYIAHHKLTQPDEAHQWFKNNPSEVDNNWVKMLSAADLDNIFLKD